MFGTAEPFASKLLHKTSYQLRSVNRHRTYIRLFINVLHRESLPHFQLESQFEQFAYLVVAILMVLKSLKDMKSNKENNYFYSSALERLKLLDV